MQQCLPVIDDELSICSRKPHYSLLCYYYTTLWYEVKVDERSDSPMEKLHEMKKLNGGRLSGVLSFDDEN